MEIYNSVGQYQCNNCGYIVEIAPVASAGVFATVGMLVLAFWGYFLFVHSRPTDSIITIFLYGAAVLAVLVIVGATLRKNTRNPIVKATAEAPDVSTVSGEHVGKRAILWVEKLGFFAGLIAPLFIIAALLGVAALIGYINYTYFSG